jgi:YbbR domain-containing protein
VQPSVEGDPAPGFIVGASTTEPKTLEVIGPESALRHVTQVITEPIWVGGAKAPVRITVPVGVADQGVRLKGTRTVTAAVDIIAAPSERELKVQVRLKNLAAGLTASVTPPIIKVRARGSQADINRLKDSAVTAYVDLEGVGEGDYGLPVRLEPMPRIGLDQPDPNVVSIHIQ